METPKYRSALIVGTGPGLSASLARLFARNGLAVAIAARQTEVEPPACIVIDGFGHGGHEPDDIVIERLFQFPLARDEPGQVGEPFVAASLDRLEILRGHDAFLHQRFAGEEFDLQPDIEFVFVGPDGPHFGARVTRNHEAN